MGQRQGGATEKEVIYVLEECARTRVKGGEILSQGLAKDMRAVLETQRENSPCELSGGPGVRCQGPLR